MNYTKLTTAQFVELLAGADPVPGGGGASALTAAIGTALGHMVGSLTVGKKKYAEAEQELKAVMEESRQLQEKLLLQIEADAKSFAPLAAAYRMPKETEEERREKEKVMQSALLEACQVPLTIMELCGKAIREVGVFARKGSVLALSDAGAAAAILEGALKAASLNIYINAGMMTDQERAGKLISETEQMLQTGVQEAQEIFREVQSRLQHS